MLVFYLGFFLAVFFGFFWLKVNRQQREAFEEFFCWIEGAICNGNLHRKRVFSWFLFGGFLEEFCLGHS
jgi:hypothetical protein